jgi:hypothetical protein
MIHSDWFKGLKTVPKSKRIIGFDIEGGGGISGFVCGSVYSENLEYFFTDSDEMTRCLLHFGYEGAWIFSHNIEYDLPLMLGEHIWEGELLFTPGGLLMAKFSHGGDIAKFYDSMNLFPHWSARTLGEQIGCPKLELPAHLMKRLSTGDTFASFTVPEQAMIKKYCTRDAEIVYRAVSMLNELVLNLGGELHPTIAGVAMDIYRRKYHAFPWKALGEKTNDLGREAFYGGRNENFAVGRVPDVNMYDITSLYPSVMDDVSFPHPNHLKLIEDPASFDEFDHWQGIAHVAIDSPLQFVPLLPARNNKRLFFPTGELKGTYTLLELREAVRRGARVRRIDWILGTPVEFNPFHHYVKELFGVRYSYLSKGDPRANLVKLILNSLYGRFGLNIGRGLLKMERLTPGTPWENVRGQIPVTVGNTMVMLKRVESQFYPTYINTLFAAQIASGARVRLLDELIKQGEDLIYCDTDSIITQGTVKTDIGLGAWRAQMEGGTADLLGAKEYALHNEVFNSQSVVKGVPVHLAEEYIRTGIVRYERALNIREAIGHGRDPGEWVEVYRSHSQLTPKRAILSQADLDQNGWTITIAYDSQELDFVKSARPPVGPFAALPPRPLYPAEL